MSRTVTAMWVYPADLLYEASESVHVLPITGHHREPGQHRPSRRKLASAAHLEHPAQPATAAPAVCTPTSDEA